MCQCALEPADFWTDQLSSLARLSCLSSLEVEITTIVSPIYWSLQLLARSADAATSITVLQTLLAITFGTFLIVFLWTGNAPYHTDASNDLLSSALI